MTEPLRRRLLTTACLAAMPALAGCIPPEVAERDADETAYAIIAQKQRAALGRNEPFTIEAPEDALRRRLLLDQKLPAAGPASFGRLFLPPVPKEPAGVSPNLPLPEEASVFPPRKPLVRGVNTESFGVDAFLQQIIPPPTAVVQEGLVARPPAGPPGSGLALGPPAPGAEEEAPPIEIDLLDALQIGALNSREYQAEKEEVYLAALDLDLERDAFEFRLTPLIDADVTSDLAEGDLEDRAGVVLSPGISVDKLFKTGAQITGQIGVDIARLISGDGESSVGTFVDASITIPLLRGAGVQVVTEPLQQAEREAIYAIWGFERFKREFAVDVASRYFNVLFAREAIENARNTLQRLTLNVERARALFGAGRTPGIEVDQARSNQLRAFSRLVLAEQRYEQELDQFKVFLGLPADARLELSDGPLEELQDDAERILGPELLRGDEAQEAAGGGRFQTTQPADDVNDPIDIAEEGLDPGESEPVPATRGVTGPELPQDVEPTETAELPTLPGRDADPLEDTPEARPGAEFADRQTARRAITVALQNRLDLATTLGRVADAQRQTVVTADALNAVFDLVASADAGGRRSSLSGGTDDADLRFDEGVYSAGVNLTLPFERTAERNQYRQSLITLDRSIRAAQQAEDQVKLQVIAALRDLRVAAEDARIQFEAILTARRRVAAANLRQELGQGQIRDITEAEEDLVDAENGYTQALVDFRIAELELQRDLGLLRVDETGLYEDAPLLSAQAP